MSVDATRWAWKQKITPTQKLALLSLADRANEANECWPSIARLEADTGLDRKTILKAISAMVDAAILMVKKEAGTANKYTLVGVEDRHGTSTNSGTATSTKNGTSTNFGTSTKNGTTPVPKTALPSTNFGTTTSTNFGTQNLSSESNKKQSRNVRDVRERTSPHFSKPTLEEISVYCKGRKNSVDPQRFLDHYTSNGWRVGKNPMRDWQAAVRTWERAGTQQPHQSPPAQPIKKYRDLNEWNRQQREERELRDKAK